MRLNDQTADGKAHPHATAFGREKSAENPLTNFRRNSDACISHRNKDLFIVQRGAYVDLSRSLRRHIHGLDGVEEQIENNLLQLNMVTQNRRQLISQFNLERYLALLNLAFDQYDG